MDKFDVCIVRNNFVVSASANVWRELDIVLVCIVQCRYTLLIIISSGIVELVKCS